MIGVGMVLSMVLGLCLGWWAGRQGIIETVALPVQPRQIAVPDAVVTPANDPRVRDRMREDFAARLRERGVPVDVGAIDADIERILSEV